jgi:predicted RNA polymerase sigma factor
LLIAALCCANWRFRYAFGRFDEARPECERAAALTRNARERELLLERAAACAQGAGTT